MTHITLLVDQLFLNENKFITPGELYYEFEKKKFNRPTWAWIHAHADLIWHWVQTKEFKLVAVSDYDSEIHKNPHYLINGAGQNQNLWQTVSYIPDRSIPILKENKIPILIFYSLEYSINAVWEEWLTKFCDLRDQKNLQESKIKILSIGSMFDKNFKKIDYYDLYPNERFKSLEVVESVGWLDLWNSYPSNMGVKFSRNELFEMNNMCAKLEDHNLKNKSSLALCLNHKSRSNRIMLLHALHANRKHIKKIISSQRFSMKPEVIIDILRSMTNDDGCSYSKHKSDFLIKLFDPRMKTNIQFMKHKEYFDTIEDPIKKFQIQLYFLAKEFKIPGKKLLDEENYKEVNQAWNKNWYLDTWCSIITETYENSVSNIIRSNGIETPMITEKTVKPILNYHPFVIFGHNYSNKLLKQYGFKTFDQTWFELPEEGAEGNQTLFERLYNLIESLKKLSTYTDEHLAAKWDMIKDDLIYNKEHLLNNNWARVQKNIILGIEEENTSP